MAITITAYDTDKNGVGVDVLTYLSKFDSSFVAAGRGQFSGASGMSGKQYASLDTNATGLVLDAGKTDWAYDINTHQVVGSLSALRFGTNTTHDAASSTFKQMTDLKISGLGLETSADANALRSTLSAADTTGLLALLKKNSINFVGSTGKDVFKSFDKNDVLNGGAGDDTLYGEGGNDTVKGGTGNDKLFGGAGNDTLIGGEGADKLDGGAGTDTASYAGATKGVVANLAKASDNTNDAKGDTYAAIENLTGSSYADNLTGNSGANTINGGKGNDALNGGAGNDTLIGGAGADKLDGGAGSDTASYAGATKGVVASLAKASINTNDAKGDTYVSIENLTGSSYADKLTGNSGANKINGGSGNDALDGGAGNDALIGGAGADKLNGGAGTDTASYAGATKGVVANLAKASVNTNDARGDTYVSIENLTGSSYADKLTGNSGANKINGGKGNDTLTGGGGADVFVFAKGYGKDTITDFQNNIDDIDLRSYNFSSVSAVLKKAVQVGTDVHIKLSSTDIIVLDDFKLKDLDASDFLL
ncbi:Ca2+-binding RTX toxin-like protein [Mycoplana sp. BE70]|uniref:calcium-binding protein n=1 Tax=Mycoplana sp. BE70 TaxID=2817775 RepID=UPI00286667FF|nr:calcium-binding protein [Mycoplana sp. BE70]MDR6756077.1 Ca2+-binding RTX toxin-like protein [Mycoplana sp. BE70]